MNAKLCRVLLTTALGILFMASSGGCASPSEKLSWEILAQRMPEKVKVVFENDFVSAFEIHLNPGDGLPVQRKQARAALALTDWKATLEDETGQRELAMERRQTAHWLPAGVLRITNSSNVQARAVVVVRKPQALPVASVLGTGKDILAHTPGMAELCLENDHVRIMRVKLAARQELPRHDGGSRLVYFVTPAEVIATRVDQTDETLLASAGEACWHGPGQLSVKNNSPEPIEFVIFELRQ